MWKLELFLFKTQLSIYSPGNIVMTVNMNKPHLSQSLSQWLSAALQVFKSLRIHIGKTLITLKLQKQNVKLYSEPWLHSITIIHYKMIEYFSNHAEADAGTLIVCGIRVILNLTTTDYSSLVINTIAFNENKIEFAVHDLVNGPHLIIIITNKTKNPK